MASRARSVKSALAACVAQAGCVALAGCAGPPGAEEARLCRLVAATLGPPGTRVEVLAQTGRRDDSGLDISRIDVMLRQPDHPPRRDFVVCRFAGRLGGRPALVGVATERGPFSPTRLFLLQRFWLDDPASALEDPAPEAPAPAGHAAR